MFSMNTLLTLSVLTFFAAYHFLRRTHRRALPPGPKGLPVIGNLLDMPREDGYRVFYEWRKLYGDIISVTVFGRSTVILNSSSMAHDLLAKRSSIYSDRPTFSMTTLAGWNNTVVMMPVYGARFRAQRRMLNNVIGTRDRIKDYAHIMESEAQACARRLLEVPDDFQEPVRKAVYTCLLMMTHGYKVNDEDDQLAKTSDTMTAHIEQLLTPGKWLVDTLPFLKYVPGWFPGGGFKTKAAEWAETLVGLVDDCHTFVEDQMTAGVALPSFSRRILEMETPSEEYIWNAKWVTLSAFLAGTDSPISTLYSLFLAMLLYPNVQHKAQEEIERVIGNGRLPRVSDRDQLPYICAVVDELFRWAPGAPLGAPHCVTEDDTYMGYFIPKGTTVIANLWGHLHDPALYPDPMRFDPDRFFVASGKPVQPNPHDYAFGYGKRVCPGTHVTDAIVFVFTATILSVYDIKPFMSKGVEEIPDANFRGSTLLSPVPFRASVSPRSSQTLALLGCPDE